MLIRPVQPADFPAIADLTNAFIVGTAVHFGEEPVTAEEMRLAWEESRGRYPFLVAEEPPPTPAGRGGGRFLGYAKAGPWRTRSAYRYCAETGIYMVPEARGRGLGAHLYRALIQACRDAGFHTLVAGATLPNPASEALHRAVGFTPAGSFREVGWKLGAWHDVIFWELPLSPGVPPAGPAPRVT